VSDDYRGRGHIDQTYLFPAPKLSATSGSVPPHVG